MFPGEFFRRWSQSRGGRKNRHGRSDQGAPETINYFQRTVALYQVSGVIVFVFIWYKSGVKYDVSMTCHGRISLNVLYGTNRLFWCQFVCVKMSCAFWKMNHHLLYLVSFKNMVYLLPNSRNCKAIHGCPDMRRVRKQEGQLVALHVSMAREWMVWGGGGGSNSVREGA